MEGKGYGRREENRRQTSEVGSQKSEVGGQRSDMRVQFKEGFCRLWVKTLYV
jgi:hypothetical protein